MGIKFSRLDDFCQSADHDADSGSGLRSVIASLLSELCHVWCSHGIEKPDQVFQSLLMSSVKGKVLVNSESEPWFRREVSELIRPFLKL